LTFAFAGTFISAIVLGLILFVWTRLSLDGVKITFVDAMSVGATLSATDPVTILAIFNAYKVDPKLYTVIFGEAILNDAIAIVLFETAQGYKAKETSVGFFSFFESIGTFLGVFFGSLCIGVLVGMITSLLLKFTYLRRFPKTESCIIVLIAYASYFFSNAIHMSGTYIKTKSKLRSAHKDRHRIAPLLRYLHQALCISQHVPKDPADDQIRFPSHGSAVRKFHLHLPWIISIH
jgi:sodium/hydrogen exchanger-like protein 6/7